MKSTIQKLRQTLAPLYGRGEAEAMISLIFSHLKGWSQVDIIMHDDEDLSPWLRSRIEEILTRLKQGEPLQYILGESRFFGMTLRVTPDVLIPRPETEGLVEMVLKFLSGRKDTRVLDLCTGSGVIAIALAKHLSFARVTALDISEPALQVARENAKKNKTHIDFVRADVLKLHPDDLPDYPWDAIVSNPPYVCENEKSGMEKNVLEFEPSLALFVPDSDPLRFYLPIARYARQTLKCRGGLFFEINPDYALPLAAELKEMGFQEVEVRKDIHGRDRYISALNP